MNRNVHNGIARRRCCTCWVPSTSYEDAVRNAISLGGDADTLPSITAGIAEAYYGGVPPEVAAPVMALLDEPLAAVVRRFNQRFGLAAPAR